MKSNRILLVVLIVTMVLVSVAAARDIPVVKDDNNHASSLASSFSTVKMPPEIKGKVAKQNPLPITDQRRKHMSDDLE